MQLLFFFHSLLAYKIKTKMFFYTFMIYDQRVIMPLINRPFKIILERLRLESSRCHYNNCIVFHGV